MKYDDKIKSRELLLSKKRIEYCLRGIINNDNSYKFISGFMDYLNFNTEDRVKIRTELMINLSGLDFPKFPSKQVDQLSYCTIEGI